MPTRSERDLDRDVHALKKNRARCPLTVLLADVLFDYAREKRSEELETLAIQVDAEAQEGRELSKATAREVLRRAARIAALADVVEQLEREGEHREQGARGEGTEDV